MPSSGTERRVGRGRVSFVPALVVAAGAGAFVAFSHGRKGGWSVTRRVRPAVLRQRIVTRLERECASMVAHQDREVQVSPEWLRGYLVGLRVARTIVRESGD